MPRKQSNLKAAKTVATPGSPQRGRRKHQSKPTPGKIPESPPRKSRRRMATLDPPAQRKSRRRTATPDPPPRELPRGRGSTRGSRNPSASNSSLSPRTSVRKSRRGSTDSSASSMGNASGTSTSTPKTRRSRRGSNSSEASAISENATITLSGSRGRRQKRIRSKSPLAVVTAKTNGASPPSSPKLPSKRKKGPGTKTVSPVRGRSSRRRTRGQSNNSETASFELDGDTEDGEGNQSISEKKAESCNSEVTISDSKCPLEADVNVNGGKICCNSEIASNSASKDADQHPQDQNSSSSNGVSAHSEIVCDKNPSNKRLKNKNMSETVSKVDEIICNNISSEDIGVLVKSDPSETPLDSSSHKVHVKRRMSSSDSLDANSGHPQKKTRTDVKSEGEVVEVCGANSISSLGSTSENPKVEKKSVPMEKFNQVMKSAAEVFLETLSLNEEQKSEICSGLSADVKDSSPDKIVEVLVEKLLNAEAGVKTMNAPRFNKFLRQLLTHYCASENTRQSKHLLCEKAVEWARERKSVNLRHELELTLMSLYYTTKNYKKAESIASALYSETKKLQDKEKTVKACLCLSQVYHAMGNISKARANITTAKTEALKIYTPPDMQGELDLQSGIMQVAEGKDMETAFSYFKEAATGFTSRKQRSRALKYMLLSKVMVNKSEEGEKTVRSQSHMQDIDEGVEAMLAITSAANRSSLADFKKTRAQFKLYLEGDMVVAAVLDDLYTSMMEKNLLNIVLPYERLQIMYIAEKIGLPREEVERRLSQMILDKRINAQLDHRDDCLYVYGAEEKDAVYVKGMESISQLDKTVSHLNRKVKKLL